MLPVLSTNQYPPSLAVVAPPTNGWPGFTPRVFNDPSLETLPKVAHSSPRNHSSAVSDCYPNRHPVRCHPSRAKRPHPNRFHRQWAGSAGCRCQWAGWELFPCRCHDAGSQSGAGRARARAQRRRGTAGARGRHATSAAGRGRTAATGRTARAAGRRRSAT